MKPVAWFGAFLLYLFLSGAVSSQAQSASSPAEGLPIQELLQTVAGKTGKKFALDPRLVTTRVTLINLDPRTLSYSDFLSVLEIHGIMATERGALVTVLPDANARQAPSPLLGRDEHPDSAFVTAVIPVRSVSAPQLVPILRPLLPQHAHLAEFPQTNTLIMVDSYANVQRIRTLVDSLDKGPPWTPDREAGESSKPARPDQGE